MPENNRLTKDDVERLSRGFPSKSRVGSRATPHRLTQKERIIFEAAKRDGYLKVPLVGTRVNLINIYTLWCEATEQPVDIRHPM